jgi:hypothetical protein
MFTNAIRLPTWLKRLMIFATALLIWKMPCNLGLVSYEESKSLFENILTHNKSKLGKLEELASKQEKIGFLRALAIGDLMDECSTLFFR